MNFKNILLPMSRETLIVKPGTADHSCRLFEKNACFGENFNPPFEIGNIPEKGRSLVVIMESTYQNESSRANWISWNIPLTGRVLEDESRGQTGKNDFGGQGYWGPDVVYPPLNCIFRFYVLDRYIHFPDPRKVTKFDLYSSIIQYAIGHGKILFRNNQI